MHCHIVLKFGTLVCGGRRMVKIQLILVKYKMADDTEIGNG